jgi:DNA-directed RNA polymerase subunit RPC12/RpoP
MIPPLVRRCRECGYLGPGRRFAFVDDDGRQLVECPRCGHCFEPVDRPWLQ